VVTGFQKCDLPISQAIEFEPFDATGTLRLDHQAIAAAADALTIGCVPRVHHKSDRDRNQLEHSERHHQRGALRPEKAGHTQGHTR
jgi:hypothetical protein